MNTETELDLGKIAAKLEQEQAFTQKRMSVEVLDGLVKFLGQELNVLMQPGTRFDYQHTPTEKNGRKYNGVFYYDRNLLLSLPPEAAPGLTFHNMGHARYSRTDGKSVREFCEKLAASINRKCGAKSMLQTNIPALIEAAEDERMEYRLRRRYRNLGNTYLPRHDKGWRREHFLERYRWLHQITPKGALDNRGRSLYWQRAAFAARGIISGALNKDLLPQDMPWDQDLCDQLAALRTLPTVNEMVKQWQFILPKMVKARQQYEEEKKQQEEQQQQQQEPGNEYISGDMEGIPEDKPQDNKPEDNDEEEEGDNATEDNDKQGDDGDNTDDGRSDGEQTPDDNSGDADDQELDDSDTGDDSDSDNDTEGMGGAAERSDSDESGDDNGSDSDAGGADGAGDSDDESDDTDEGSGGREGSSAGEGSESGDGADESGTGGPESEDDGGEQDGEDGDDNSGAGGDDLDEGEEEKQETCDNCGGDHDTSECDQPDQDGETDEDTGEGSDEDLGDVDLGDSGDEAVDEEDLEGEGDESEPEEEPQSELEAIKEEVEQEYQPPRSSEGNIADEFTKGAKDESEVQFITSGEEAGFGDGDVRVEYDIPPSWASVRGTVASIIGPVRKRAQNEFKENEIVDKSKGWRNGRFHSKSLIRAHVTNSDKIYSKRDSKGQRSYDVYILVDISTSMNAFEAGLPGFPDVFVRFGDRPDEQYKQAMEQAIYYRRMGYYKRAKQYEANAAMYKAKGGKPTPIAQRATQGEYMRDKDGQLIRDEIGYGYKRLPPKYEWNGSRFQFATRMVVAIMEALKSFPEIKVGVGAYNYGYSGYRGSDDANSDGFFPLKELNERLTDGVKDKILRRLLRPSGGTAILRPLQRITERFQQSHAEKKILIVLTDGEFGDDPKAVQEQIEKMHRMGIEMVVLTTGYPCDEAARFVGKQNAARVTDENIGGEIGKHLRRMVKA